MTRLLRKITPDALKWRAGRVSTMFCLFLLSPSLRGEDFHVVLQAGRQRVSFDNLDLRPLETEFRRYRTNLSDPERAYLVQANFHFTYFNKLARANFVRDPDPQQVAEQIRKLVELDGAITELISEGKKTAIYGTAADRKQMAGRISGHARRILSIFDQYFLETGGGSYPLQMPRIEDEQVRFIHYVVQAGHIAERLSGVVHQYFFDPSPATTYAGEQAETGSIHLMAKCLIRLEEWKDRHDDASGD